MKLLISALPLLLQLAAGSLPPPVQPVCNFQMDGRISSYISARSRYFFNSTEDETDTPITIVAPGPGALRISADVLAVVLREIFRYENTTVLPYDYPCSYPYSCVIRLNAVQPSGDNHYIDSGFLYRNRQCYIYASPSRPDCPLNSTTAQDSNPGPSYIRLLESTCSTGLALPAHLTVTGAATAGGYAHISGTGSQQKKLLLTNLAARDPELREFLATFFLPDPGALLSASSHPCDWVRNELLRQRNRSAENATAQGYWSVPPMNQSAYLQPMRLALMWPNGSKLNDIQVLHWARRTVAQLNSEPVDPADAAPAANASAAPAAPRDALRADAIRLRRAGLRLHLEARGMDCNKADALQFFADSVCPPARLRGGVSGPPVRGPLLGLLAATCSDTVRPIAELSTETRSVVVSPTVESAVYNDPTAYPYFFRTIPSLDAYSEVVTQFLRRHNWPDVALLSSSKLFLRREQFEGHRDGLAVCFEEVVDEESLTLKQAEENLRNAKLKRCQIFAMDYMRRGTCLYLCAAYKRNMTQKNNYMFILSDSARNVFVHTMVFCDGTGAMLTMDNPDGCTDDNLKDVADGHLIVRQVPFESSQSSASVPKSDSERLPMADFFQYYTQQAILLLARAATKLVERRPSAVYNLNSPSVALMFKESLETTTFGSDKAPLKLDSNHDIGRGSMSIVLRRFMQYKSNTKSFFTDSFNKTAFGQLRTVKLMNQRDSKAMSNQPLDVYVWQRLPTGLQVSHHFKPTAEVRYATENTRFIQLLRAPYGCNQGLLAALRTGLRCSETILAVVGLAFFLCLLVLVLAFTLLLRHYRRRECQLRAQPFQLLRDQLAQHEVQRSQVVLNRKMGAGYFGTVYGGEVNLAGRGSGEASAWTSCVIKVANDEGKQDSVVQLLKEAVSLTSVQHENVIRLLGVCTADTPYYILMEMCLHGDLKGFLMARRTQALFTPGAPETSPLALTRYALDIASGVEYLHCRHFVHRDLALRNCLINDRFQVKIGDFGLARTVKDYYRTQTQKMVPVRWMPPEAIQYYVFTVHSDVWSYAVVLYELVTFGKYPFEELSQQQVMAQVNHGVTLLSRFPASASPILYAIVSRCWQFEPKQRPVMSEVVAALRDNPECVTPCLDEAPPMQPPEELDRAGGGDPLRAVGRQPSGGGGGGTRDGWSSLSGSSRQLNALSVNSSFSSSAVVVAASLVHAGPTGVSGGRRSVGGVGGTKPRVFSVSGAARTAAAAEVALLSSGRRGSRPKPDPHSSGSAPPGVGVVGDSDSLTDSLAALTHNMPD